MLLEFLSLCRFDLVEIFVDAVQRSELRDQSFRAFFTDARNAWDVVDRIAPDRHDVKDFLGRQAEGFLHTFRVIKNFATAVIERNAVPDELKEILV